MPSTLHTVIIVLLAVALGNCILGYWVIYQRVDSFGKYEVKYVAKIVAIFCAIASAAIIAAYGLASLFPTAFL